ncbi:hypothetical protein PC9H_010307 [Pleurotus ostreatus]|uniref:DUF6532 domain-containing protein n=1 Tax=Pleurotus ostreatus TaxID=5322 RepID=A0A8H6ZSB3_PLEOS|nr:uncharacterized protein PC9H_010307 [Pleurotus ostreatus]KAF7424996.1 hypothetical protein PC9H_010307 [Pleurotus ostreatus]
MEPEEREISPFMVAFVMTMVEIRLHELLTGSNTTIELKGTTWVEPYRRHMDSLFEMLPSLHDEVLADLDLEIMEVSD